MVEFYTKYYLLESGELLIMAEEFRAEFIKKKSEILEYVKSIGAEAYRLDVDDTLYAVKFPGGIQPDNFKRPDKYGCCEPYKRSKYRKEFEKYKLPCCKERLQNVLKCPFYLEYKTKNGKGFSSIGHPFRPIGVYWYSEDGPILLGVPDVERHAEDMAGDGITFVDGCDKWRLGDFGARAIIKEEWDLMVAKHKQDMAA